MRVLLVDRPGAVQTVINFYTPAPKVDDPQRVGMRLINTILGGSFTSRLNQNLRERNGFTYGAGSRVNQTRFTGWFMARSSVQSETTGKALAEFMKEFNAIAAGTISADELNKAKKTVRTEMINDFATLNGYVNVGADLLVDAMPWATLAGDMGALEGLSLEQINALSKSMIRLDKGVLVLVGDKGTILGKIKEAGVSLPTVVEVDEQGEVRK